MKTEFIYSILNYVHSPLKKERLNVGIVFYFRDSNQIIFRHPKGFRRFREFYSDFQEWQLNYALKSISERVFYLNNERGLFSDEIREEELLNNILLEDSTTLRFSKPKRSLSESDDISFLAESYYNLYFSEFGSSVKREKHDEQFILKTFKQKLIEQNENAQNYLQKDSIIEVPKTKVKFEYVWYNGSPNLVKPISFDLEDESSINHKAIFHYAQLGLVSEEINKHNGKINFLITSPSNGNPGLIKAYRKAIDILKDTSVEKVIVDERHLDEFVHEVSRKIHAPKVLFPFKNKSQTNFPSGTIPPTLPLIE